MADKPVIVGIGGTTRANSSTEKALRFALKVCEKDGAETILDLQVTSPDGSTLPQKAMRLGRFARVRLGIQPRKDLAGPNGVALLAFDNGDAARNAEAELNLPNIHVAMELQRAGGGGTPAEEPERGRAQDDHQQKQWELSFIHKPPGTRM